MRRKLVVLAFVLLLIPSAILLWVHEHPYIIEINAKGEVSYSLWTVDGSGKPVVLSTGRGHRIVVSQSILRKAEEYSRLRNSSYPLLGVDVWIASGTYYYSLPPTTFLLVKRPSLLHPVKLIVEPNMSLARRVSSFQNVWKTTYFRIFTLKVPYLVLFKNSTGSLFLNVRYVGYTSYSGPRMTLVWGNLSLVRVLDSPIAGKYYTGVSFNAEKATETLVAGVRMKVALVVQEDYSSGKPTGLKRYFLIPVWVMNSGPAPITFIRWQETYTGIPKDLMPENVSYLPDGGYGILGGGTVTLLQVYSDVWEGNQSTYALGVGLPLGYELTKKVPLPGWFQEVPLMFGNSFAGTLRLHSTARIFGGVTSYRLQLKQAPMDDKYSFSRVPFGLYLIVKGTSPMPGGTSQ